MKCRPSSYGRQCCMIVGCLPAGAALELSTILAPHAFLPLACSANLAKNLAAVAASSTRAPIYRTFALQNNLADITAKGESVANLADILGTIAGQCCFSCATAESTLPHIRCSRHSNRRICWLLDQCNGSMLCVCPALAIRQPVLDPPADLATMVLACSASKHTAFAAGCICRYPLVQVAFAHGPHLHVFVVWLSVGQQEGG